MKCDFCPHGCEIFDNMPNSSGQGADLIDRGKNFLGQGFCKTRTIMDGEIVSLNYGQITSLALDPIEKKPLAMFMPGSKILSAGSWGCNMRCPWCQNDSISRGPTSYHSITPDMLVEEALAQKSNGNIGIAYTYNEALTSFEYVYETAVIAKKAGLVNVLVTNGMAEDKYIRKLLPYIDALNIDLKTIYPDKYKQIGGDLGTVLNTITLAIKTSHVEVTTLIVPGFNDTEKEMRELSEKIAELDCEIPLHITRFFPAGDMKGAEPTNISLIYRLKEIAEEKLQHVYTGNCF